MFSKEALIDSARDHGLLPEEEPILISETLVALKKISDEATAVIFENPEAEGLSMAVIRKAFNYAFAKGMEVFFLWRDSAGDDLHCAFSRAELLDATGRLSSTLEIEAFIDRARDKCNSMLNDFQEWLKSNQDLFQGGFLDLYTELEEAMSWSCRIGLSYAASLA